MTNEIEINTLNLIFTTESGSVCAVDPRFVLGNINKGHLVIFFEFILKNKVSIASHNRYKFIFKKAKCDKISHFISNVDWVRLYENKSVQEMYDELIFYTNEASNQFIPTLNVTKLKSSTAPWVKDDLKILIKRKKSLRYTNCSRKWKDTDLCKEYRKICKQVKSEVKKARLAYEKDLVEKAKRNPKLLYKYLNSQQVVKESIKALRRPDGDLTQEPIEIANLLNKYFQEVFVTEEDGELPPFEVVFSENSTDFVDLDPNNISYKMVLDKLRALDQNKACGADKMHPYLLKNCAEAFALPITLIFRASLETSQLPIQFRTANGPPLFKKGDKTVPNNYRPESLTSVPCKIMESIIRAEMEEYSCDRVIGAYGKS